MLDRRAVTHLGVELGHDQEPLASRRLHHLDEAGPIAARRYFISELRQRLDGGHRGRRRCGPHRLAARPPRREHPAIRQQRRSAAVPGRALRTRGAGAVRARGAVAGPEARRRAQHRAPRGGVPFCTKLAVGRRPPDSDRHRPAGRPLPGPLGVVPAVPDLGRTLGAAVVGQSPRSGGWGGFILPAGQSGIPFSRHYRDQNAAWRNGGLWRIPVDPVAVESRAVAVAAASERGCRPPCEPRRIPGRSPSASGRPPCRAVRHHPPRRP